MTRRVAVGLVLLIGVIVAVLAVVVIGGDTEDGYSSGVRANFVDACVAGATDQGLADPESFCVCTFEGIEAEIPYERFVELDEQMRATPGVVPPEIDAIRSRCLPLDDAPPPEES